jgi:hypothetical protein
MFHFCLLSDYTHSLHEVKKKTLLHLKQERFCL